MIHRPFITTTFPRGAASFVLRVSAAILCVAIVLDTYMPRRPVLHSPDYLDAEASHQWLDREGVLLQAALTSDDAWCFPQPLTGHSDYLIEATLAAEDQRFYAHNGVDFYAVVRAAIQNVGARRIVSGASTLTMQLVKMTEHTPRTALGKIAQARTALNLEGQSSKEELLAAYLNRAPYGANLVGAEAASRRYFGKSSRELSLPEAALLAALPKAPARYNPLIDPGAAKSRRDYVLNRMQAEGFISGAELRRALDAPLSTSFHEFPMRVPHLAERLADDANEAVVTRLTTDSKLQQRAQGLLKRYLPQFDGGITNGAAMVVDVATGEVRVYVGSADYFASPGGQMDLARARRSPGSTLKPFTYAEALEKNRLYPDEMILDDTLDYGRYSPGNYDKQHNGLVSAGDALRSSLNVPAVMVLNRVGPEALQDRLTQLGLRTLDESPEHYGLGLTLGNCEVRLDELAAAYTALAAQGVYRPLRFETKEPEHAVMQVYSPGTIAALFEMMQQPLPHNAMGNRVLNGVAPAKVCWKTGTSTGHHDAWSFVFNRHYVVGVWLGNADGRPSDRLVGATVALPLASLIFGMLDAPRSPAWPDVTETLKSVQVCSGTGLPLSRWCPTTESSLLPTEQLVLRRCDVHRPAKGGDVIERWPGDARHWNLARVKDTIPDAIISDSVRLRIISPVRGGEYVATGARHGDEIRLSSSLDASGPVHWYYNERYLGLATSSKPLLLSLDPGTHTITCLAESGASDTVEFRVSALAEAD